MRHNSRFTSLLSLVTALALIVLAGGDAHAGPRWERFKRSPTKVAIASGVGTAALLNPGATLGALAFGGGLAVGAAGGVLHGIAVGATALAAATALSPLAGLVFTGATVYAGIKGGQAIGRKFREYRQRTALERGDYGFGGAGRLEPPSMGGPSELRQRFMGAPAPAYAH